ncbi:hypothetical protein D3C81_1624100 [compost metagenome]
MSRHQVRRGRRGRREENSRQRSALLGELPSAQSSLDGLIQRGLGLSFGPPFAFLEPYLDHQLASANWAFEQPRAYRNERNSGHRNQQHCVRDTNPPFQVLVHGRSARPAFRAEAPLPAQSNLLRRD